VVIVLPLTSGVILQNNSYTIAQPNTNPNLVVGHHNHWTAPLS